MSGKYLSVFSILVVLGMLFTACSQPTFEPPTVDTPIAEKPMAEGDCASGDIFCVGLVTDVGEVDDKSFNQSAWEGVQQAEAELDAQVKFVETRDAEDYGPNIELFADQNFDVIVTVGSALAESTREEAVKYTDIKFIGIDQFQAEPIANVASLIFPEDKLGFLGGALSALLSKSGTIAAVLGTDLDPRVVAYKEGFAAGAKYINPDINLILNYHPGNFDAAFIDSDWGAGTAKQAVDQGADVIFSTGGMTGNGALIEAAGNPGIYCIGGDTDQWQIVPEAQACLVSSAVKRITPGVFELVKLAKEDKFPFGNNIGIVGLAPFHDFEKNISQEIKDKMAKIELGLSDGSISTGYNPEG